MYKIYFINLLINKFSISISIFQPQGRAWAFEALAVGKWRQCGPYRGECGGINRTRSPASKLQNGWREGRWWPVVPVPSYFAGCLSKQPSAALSPPSCLRRLLVSHLDAHTLIRDLNYTKDKIMNKEAENLQLFPYMHSWANLFTFSLAFPFW